MKKPGQRTSEKLLEIMHSNAMTKNICFEDIIKLLGARAFGIALLFFSLPSALPFSVIPGVAFVFSVPIFFFSVQMILGRNTLWLPKKIAKKTVPYQSVSKIIQKTVPYLKKAEYFLKPRWAFMTSRPLEIMNGLVILCLAILLILPIPFSNFIFAILLITFSLGLIEKDGVVIMLGYAASLLYVSFIFWVIAAAVHNFMTWV
ncbi:exopolysaccharide biosynthesis protein [Legionella pneumophila]|uniref:exopolysaccharide biosynthesis protein n=1 Tax=Legionella pneumophila TaxID=446 RepID=UPI0008633CA7|nr:exopolysaccharide biosynthesis protein [Legionella pneumophila]AOU64482.1 sugar transporter [Legionella pneumophila]